MKEQIISSFSDIKSAMNEKKKEAKKEHQMNQPIGKGYEVTPEMLTSPTSKKLIKYFFKTYPNLIEELKGGSWNQPFINDLEKTINENGDLSKLNLISLDNFYKNSFLRKIPLTSDRDARIFDEITDKAGCSIDEKFKAKELMKALIGPALDNMIQRAKMNKEKENGGKPNFSKN